MNELMNLYGVTERNNIPVVSSRKVAEVFKRRHDHVLKNIKELTDPTSGVSENFRHQNFITSFYKDSTGRKLIEYLLTKDGFAMVVMEFKTKRARQFKEEYINQFNQMERFIKDYIETRADFPEFTEAIMNAHEEPKHYHFSNELDLINRIVLGMTAKQFRETNGLDKVQSIRPYLSPEQMNYIKKLQRIDIGLIVAIPDFQQRKEILAEQFNRIKLIQIAS